MKAVAALLITPILLVVAPHAQADTILGIYAGGQIWDTDSAGRIGSGDSQQAFAFGDERQQSLYIALEHPLPLIPNIKLRQNDLSTAGATALASDFSFAGTTFANGASISSSVDLSHTDVTLYYEIFDNDLLSLDLGVTGKKVDGWLAVRDAQSESRLQSDGWVPTGYAQLRVGIPATPLTAYALANAISIDDSSIRDIEAGIEYRLLDNLAIDLNLQLGYRDIQIELDDLDSAYTDLQFKGPYLGVEVHF